MKVGDRVVTLKDSGVGNYIWTVISINENQENCTIQSSSDMDWETTTTEKNLISIDDPNLVDILEPIEGHFYKRSISYRLARIEKALGIKNGG